MSFFLCDRAVVMKPSVQRCLVILALVTSIVRELGSCRSPVIGLQSYEGRARDLSSYRSSPVLQVATKTSQVEASREFLGRYSPTRITNFNDRMMRSGIELGPKDVRIIASQRGDFHQEPNARNPENSAESALTTTNCRNPRALLQSEGVPSCPLDFQFVQDYPWYRRQCQNFDPHFDGSNSSCCRALSSILDQAMSEYLRTSGQFMVKDTATMSICLANLQAVLYSEVNSLLIISTCSPSIDYSWFVSDPSSCQGIETRADFERLVGVQTINSSLNLDCSGSLFDLQPCNGCTKAVHSVVKQLTLVSANNSLCRFYPQFYAAGISNSDGPFDRGTANCIFSVGIINVSSGRSEIGNLALIGIAPAVLAFLLLVFIISVLYRRNVRLAALARKYDIEESALIRGPQNFKYRELSLATKGFSSLLGSGGFGSVYKGTVVLKGEKHPTEIAVKRVSATSRQGAQEFLAEVKIIGQVQHRNLVRLLGWSHERGELLLVYQYMPHGSVDQHLYNSTPAELVLTWSKRLKIVSGVAIALAYLHEEWEQRVIHRDVKSSNVMLDRDFNARLGDFGLARLPEHDQAPESTAVVAGTYGYLAPELSQTLKPTEKTDVYSFGALVLEIATGKKPLLSKEDRESFDKTFLQDWVWDLYRDDTLLDAADCVLHNAYDPGEMTMFLKIGLLCSHPNPDERPRMREVINIWKGLIPFPALSRSKPVPIFPSSSPYSLRLDTGQEIDISVSPSTSSYGHGDVTWGQTLKVDTDGHSTLTVGLEDEGKTISPGTNYGQKGSSPEPAFLSRPPITSLPF